MPKWSLTYNRVLSNEGGYNKPFRQSGETYKGIDRLFHPQWQGWRIIDAYKRRFGTPPEEAIINDATLEQLVSNFYWTYVNALVHYNAIPEQTLADLIVDFLVHKQYDAVRVINATAQAFNIQPKSNLAVTTPVLQVMQQRTQPFYTALRNNRITYYQNPAAFGSSLRFSNDTTKSFVQRVQRFPPSIQVPKSFNWFWFLNR